MNTPKTRTATLVILGAALALIGCGASATQNEETTVAGRAGAGSEHRAGRGSATSGREQASGQSDCRVEPVYFAYDSTDLDARARASLERNATCLQQRTGTAAVTGMADERGTEEYNLALGDRRARTATHYMGNLGVEQSRMSVRSVGEEYATGSGESGYARDRRAEVEVR